MYKDYTILTQSIQTMNRRIVGTVVIENLELHNCSFYRPSQPVRVKTRVIGDDSTGIIGYYTSYIYHLRDTKESQDILFKMKTKLVKEGLCPYDVTMPNGSQRWKLSCSTIVDPKDNVTVPRTITVYDGSSHKTVSEGNYLASELFHIDATCTVKCTLEFVDVEVEKKIDTNEWHLTWLKIRMIDISNTTIESIFSIN